MSRGNVRPAIKDRPTEADNRLTELERRSVGDASAVPIVSGAPFPGFSFPDLVEVGAQSPVWWAAQPISYGSAQISCRVSGGGNGIFLLYYNGSGFMYLTLGPGEFTHVYTAVFSIQAGDSFFADCTAIDGQGTVSIQLHELSI